ncbi:MAG: phenylalanine--tRNA ligase subunit beta [Luteitalea sp.]|nr:phenylalanine--tRNA ligase subunit beta [Luteitalea sp.]
MRILVSWLRDLVDVPVTIERLAADLHLRGFEVASVEPWPPQQARADDAVIDFEITANRPDCLSVAGIAREVSVLYDVPLRLPKLSAPREGAPALPITIEAPPLCPRYVGALVDVHVGASPDWLVDRLAAAGIRAINNIVDVTNYVLVELGHPLHAFAFEKLTGGELRIRPARNGEEVTTLDGQPRTLDERMLVIADRDRAQAVAGVIGGRDSEVSLGTQVIALESAYFQPLSIRRTSKRLGLSTEASYRFERGADPNAPLDALIRACDLLQQLGAGRLRPGIADVWPSTPEPRVVPLRLARVAVVTGLEVGAGAVEARDVERILRGLGFGVEPTGNAVWQVTVPTWRPDVTREIDVIEEVARSVGYDRLPSTFPTLHRPPAPPDARLERQRVARDLALAAGFAECVTFSFVERAAALAFADAGELVPLANPLSEHFAIMRPSLLPGLVDAVSHNRRRERRDVRLFEIGARFSASVGETRGLGLVWTGAASPAHWSGSGREADLFDLMGVTSALGARFGFDLLCEPADVPYLVSGHAARIVMQRRGAASNGRGAPSQATSIGVIGQLTSSIAEARDLPAAEPVFVAELDLDQLGAGVDANPVVRVEPLPRHPSVVRDLSMLLPADLPAASVRGTIRSVAPATLAALQEFDRYHGRGIPEGFVSLSLRLTFRAPDRTLIDVEVQEAMESIVAALRDRHGARLR